MAGNAATAAPGFGPSPAYAPAPAAAPKYGNGVFTWYSITLWASLALMVIAVGLMILGVAGREEEIVIAGAVGFWVAVIPSIASAVLAFILLYRGWNVIQPLRQLSAADQTMPSPGQAVGFLFIPFYNLYWMFVAYHGWAQRANRLMADRQQALAPANEGLALALPILVIVGNLLGFVPFLNIVLFIAMFVVGFLVHRNINSVTKQLQS